MRRVLIVLIIVIAAAALGFGAWWLLSQNQQTQTPPAGTTGSLPEVGTQGTGTGAGGTGSGTSGAGSTVIGSFTPGSASGTTNGGAAAAIKSFGVAYAGPTANYFVDARNNIIIVGPDGTITEVTAGASSTLSSTPIANFIGATFSYDGKKVLVSFGDPANPQSSIFDVATKSWTPLPTGIVSPQFAPSDYRIAYLTNGTTTSLFTLDTVNPKKAATLLLTSYLQDLTLSWIAPTQMVLAGRPGTYEPTNILLFDTAKSTLTPIVYEGMGAESIWTGPSGSTPTLGLVFMKSGSGYSLRLANATGSALQTMNFLTLPSKCGFSIEPGALPPAPTSTATSTSNATGKMIVAPTVPMLYCGIPRDASGFTAAHLPDDYDQMALFTVDDLYRVNIVTGTTTALLADASQSFDIFKPKWFAGSVFFINRYNQELYGLTP